MVYKIKTLKASSKEILLEVLNEIDGQVITVFRKVNEVRHGVFVSTTIDYDILYKEEGK